MKFSWEKVSVCGPLAKGGLTVRAENTCRLLVTLIQQILHLVPPDLPRLKNDTIFQWRIYTEVVSNRPPRFALKRKLDVMQKQQYGKTVQTIASVLRH